MQVQIAPATAKTFSLGQSVACSGICLTVTGMEEGGFTADLSAETLACTTAQYWQTGTKLNLERALKMGDELGGHLVSGHVDGVASLHEITPAGDAYNLTITPPIELLRFIAPKGSVTLDGISLTVNHVTPDAFTVMIIPHTWQHTTLHTATAGTRLNLEVDLLARYVARLQEYGDTHAASQ